MKKQFLLAGLTSLVLMSCGGAQTSETPSLTDSTTVCVDTTNVTVDTTNVTVDTTNVVKAEL
jgi:hypothetical protein